MRFFLDARHLKHYRELARFLIKYGRSDMIIRAGLEKFVDEDRPVEKIDPKAEELSKDLEKMGPTYVKLGQFLSTRSDLLAPEYIEALARLQDSAERFPYEKVEEIIASELGMPISKLFSFFDKTPLAAASLAQVHRAVLIDGRSVAVKVQRPGIRKQIATDLDMLIDLAGFLDRHIDVARRYMLQATIEEFRKAVLRELDFRQEALNLVLLADNLREYDKIVVPMPIDAFTTSKVLTMEYIRGQKVTSIVPLRRQEINGSELADELFGAYLKQILIDGYYHADPHPGNVFLTEDGRIALIDLGMVARISDGMQKKLLGLTLSISEGKAEEAVEYAIEIGEKTPAFDEPTFSRHVKELVTRWQRITIGQMQVGRVILEMLQVAGASGFRFPSELAMLGKCMLNLDNIGRTLDPWFDPNAALQRHAGKLFRQRFLKRLSTANIYKMTMDLEELAEHLPQRLGKIADILAGNDFKIGVNAIDENRLMRGFQKIANRVAVGIIIAAAIIGAAIMMHVQTPGFTILGYPGPAMILFIVAAIGGFLLAIVMVLGDNRAGKKTKGTNPRRA
jgi:predicted unusual protein kinase regulating ubiquinone biosynthesis (AarF/ABC1/UbiB family)